MEPDFSFAVRSLIRRETNFYFSNERPALRLITVFKMDLIIYTKYTTVLNLAPKRLKRTGQPAQG